MWGGPNALTSYGRFYFFGIKLCVCLLRQVGIFFHNVLIDTADLDLAPSIPPPVDTSSQLLSPPYPPQPPKPATEDRPWAHQPQHVGPGTGAQHHQLRASPTAAIAPAPRSPPAWGDSSAAADAFSTALHSVRPAPDASLGGGSGRPGPLWLRGEVFGRACRAVGCS